MTLFDSETGALTGRHARGPGPKTHALVIGVSYYHHLSGGQGVPLREPMDLEQLSSPTISAVAFAEWILSELNNLHAPLGSVEVLLSPVADVTLPDGTRRRSTRATMQEIRRAFDQWYVRCDSDPGNVAIFYFCGHGLMRQNLALLAEDFGVRPLAPFETAIDINSTWEGMARCKAQTQCYFIDCCRQASWAMQRQLDDPATTLVNPQFGIASERDAPRFMATGPARSAYGMSGSTTLFTNALLECLKRGARKEGARWVVTTQRLSEALCLAMRESRDCGERPQFPSPEGIIRGNVIHELTGPPQVPVTLGCSPDDATQHAQLELFNSGNAALPCYRRDVPAAQRWRFSAQAGHYTARASFAQCQYQTGENQVWIDPPGPIEENVFVKS